MLFAFDAQTLLNKPDIRGKFVSGWAMAKANELVTLAGLQQPKTTCILFLKEIYINKTLQGLFVWVSQSYAVTLC